MTRSEGLRKEVQAMAAVEQALTGLPPRSRYRVVGWILDNFAEPDAPPEPERNLGFDDATPADPS